MLIKHLFGLRRSGKVEPWDDSNILPGEEWDNVIKSQLTSADIIILLISADALETDYIWDVEIDEAMKRHKRNEARVIPVILRPCSWKFTPFKKLNVLPVKGKAVTEWGETPWDAAWLEVVEGIEEVIDDLSAKS